MSVLPDRLEVRFAVASVRLAAAACRRVQAVLVNGSTLEKKDRSPVTVADFASQAIVLGLLAHAFPDDPAIGEEGADALRSPASEALRAEVVDQVRRALGQEGDGASEAAVLGWIDRGRFDPSEAPDVPRWWTLDPIDGTKGFLRGDQYAVALALIEDGRPEIGVLGCPNLDGGQVLVAVRDVGAWRLPLVGNGLAQAEPVAVSEQKDLTELRLCESYEKAHSDQSASGRIAERLGITAEPVRIDSQCKYALVAQGAAEIYLRLPTRPGYREKVWDHAAGSLIVESAGGHVTDVYGEPLDFSRSRLLYPGRGVVASHGPHHGRLVAETARAFALRS